MQYLQVDNSNQTELITKIFLAIDLETTEAKDLSCFGVSIDN